MANFATYLERMTKSLHKFFEGEIQFFKVLPDVFTNETKMYITVIFQTRVS